MVFNADGSLGDSQIYQAWAHNFAKLAYNSVAAWLENTADMPGAVAAVPGLADNLRWQDQIAQRIKDYRHSHGALSLETIEARPVFEGDQILALEREEKNRAKEIIEDFMIAANGVTARYLDTKKFPSIRRMVRTPKRWSELLNCQNRLSAARNPDAKAWKHFCPTKNRRSARFPLSLSVIKLLARVNILQTFRRKRAGHFGWLSRTMPIQPLPRVSRLGYQRLIKAAWLVCLYPTARGTDTLAAIAPVGRRCQQSGTPGWQIGGGIAASIQDWRAVRLNRHWFGGKRHLGTPPSFSGGRKAGQGRKRGGCRSPPSRAIGIRRCRSGIYRFRKSLTTNFIE
jgi:exoribonuclease-2